MKRLFPRLETSEHFWLWICITCTQLCLKLISQKRNMLVAGEHLIRSLVEKYGKHTVYTQMVVVEHGMQKHATLCI